VTDIFYAKLKPVASPRQTQRDKWKPRECVKKYRVFCDLLRLEARKQNFKLNKNYTVVFGFKIPKTMKNVHPGQPMEKRPDIDNLVKAVQDALYQGDDGAVSGFIAVKIYQDDDCIFIRNEPGFARKIIDLEVKEIEHQRAQEQVS
jgi:Holliday junction resolvase RusA-like endonuclease